MANELQEFTGTMNYNAVKLYSNGTKKMFNGFITLKDTNGQETSYKMVSFRSQVCYQSEALGERGMKGKLVSVHGVFKENTYQGKTEFQLMAEKIFIQGMEHLAIEADSAEQALPTAPGGQLSNAPQAAPMGAVIQGQQAPQNTAPQVQQAPQNYATAPQTPQAPQTPGAPGIVAQTPQLNNNGMPMAPTTPTAPGQMMAPTVMDSTTIPQNNTLVTPQAPAGLVPQTAPVQTSNGPGAISGGFCAPRQN